MCIFYLVSVICFLCGLTKLPISAKPMIGEVRSWAFCPGRVKNKRKSSFVCFVCLVCFVFLIIFLFVLCFREFVFVFDCVVLLLFL